LRELSDYASPIGSLQALRIRILSDPEAGGALAAENDLLFVPLEGPEPRTTHLARSADRTAATGVQRFALDVGLDTDDIALDEHPLGASSVLDLPARANWDDIADRVRDRGEAGLLEWLPVGFT
jgi:hypothetical protein